MTEPRLAEISDRRRVAALVWWPAVALIALLHLQVQTLGINTSELWLDEASTWGVAVRPLRTVLTLPTAFHSQPPLYYILLHFVIELGSAEWVLRGLSWLACMLLVLFVLTRLRELTLAARVCWCLFFIYSPFTFPMERSVRPYGMAALLSFVSTIALLRLIERPDRRGALQYFAMALAMLYTMAFDVAVFAVQVLYVVGVLVARLRRDGGANSWARDRWLVLSTVATTVLYLPYLALVYHWQGANGHPSWAATKGQLTSWAAYSSSIETLLPFGAPWSTVLYGLMLVAVVADLRARRGRALLLVLLVFGQIAFVRGFCIGRTPIEIRYWTPALPAFYLLVALGLDGCVGMVRPVAWVAVLSALIWLNLDAWPSYKAFLQAPLAKDTWRSMHESLTPFVGKKVIFFDTGYLGQMLEYETRNDPTVSLALQKGSFWAAGGDSHLDPSYIERIVDENSADTHCFFYFRERAGPFESAFLPAMHRIGFVAAGFASGLRAFCRP